MLATFFKSRGAGFYVTAVGALLALIGAIAFASGYAGSVYMSWWAFVLPILSVAAFLGLSIFKKTASFAAPVFALLNFIAFLVFVEATYLYLSEVFFSGFSMDAFANMDAAYLISALSFLLAAILGNVGAYLKNNKEEASV